MTSVLQETDKQRRQKEGHVARKAHTEVMRPQPRSAWGHAGLEGAGRSLPSSLPRERGPADDSLMSDFWPGLGEKKSLV